MTVERSTLQTHKDNIHQEKYDWEYYKQLLPYIKGEVLDVGCGAGMFVSVYAKKDEVTSVIGIDKYTDEFPQIEKAQAMQFNLPDEFGISPEAAKFDTVVSTEFIEHIRRDQLEPMLEKIKFVMKDDGVFVGSTPNKIAPTTNEFHLYEYTLIELLGIFKNYFTEVEMWDNGQNCTLWKATK